MKQKCLSFGLGCFWAVSACASIQSGADRLINQVDPRINLGVEVIDLTTGVTLYSRNADRSFIPASNMKLFSDAAALMVLGPDYRFKNQLSTNATQLSQGVLHGNLYLILPGDPSFSSDDLRNLLAALRQWQIHTIQGNVVIDSSHAQVAPYAPGWMKEDLAYSYGAPVAPLILDTNRLTVTANPGSKAGEPGLVEVDDSSGAIQIDNQIQTRASSKGCGIDFAMGQDNHLTVRGCLGVGQWAVMQRMAIRNPLNYAQGVIRRQLAENNIQLNGEVTLGKAPSGSLLLATQESKPIAQLMADTLKPSDNLYAESMYLHAAHKLNGSPVDWAEAQPIIKNFIQKQTGINLSNAVLVDGSGLSRYDLLTPRQTVELLRFLHERFPFSYEFIAALPVSGRDGTLQRRFRTPKQQDLVRAKTGTMKGVVSLSGYLYTANGHTLAFAMYANRMPGTKPSVSGKYRWLIDSLCTYLLEQNPGSGQWAKIFSPHKRMQFQQQLTQAQVQKSRAARWRGLEATIKRGLQGQSVAVVFRGNELILQDHQADANKVWQVLQKVRKQYPFAVAFTASAMPITATGRPWLLWLHRAPEVNEVKRIWTIREAV